MPARGYMPCSMSDAVVHNAANREYRLSPGTMTFFHTLTPPALRGRGLAAKVVQAALDYARSEGLKVIPLCWYVSGHIEAHPELRDLLAPQAR